MFYFLIKTLTSNLTINNIIQISSTIVAFVYKIYKFY
uniref:Uncharacterized protein n=1 Tax=Porphyridium purpureum TaxID=35688 RepID=W0RYL4_PORPP|nr:hypothetical protein Y721_p187 [Porphyridium purpureum]BAO23621.1 hypothetical protein [Porphyridium purpureum]